MHRRLLLSVLLLALLLPMPPATAADDPDLTLFYSETCPHCARERAFLEQLATEFPDADFVEFPISDEGARSMLAELLRAADAERYLGVVPITFVGERYFVGFDDASGAGAAIRSALVERLTDGVPQPTPSPASARTFVLPLIGEVNSGEYSLPVLTVLLGLLDGFNVCSLGALVLILGLVLALRDRRRIILFGGTFLLTTALVYGGLIVLWFRAFDRLARYTGVLEAAVAIFAVAGGAYFLREWRRMRRFGPTCGFSNLRIVNWVTQRVQTRLEGAIHIAPAIVAILLFAGVITMVEFPCSAAVPVVFAGVLADSGLSTAAQGALILLFVLCYLLDEIIVFGIAVSRMRLWLTSPGVVVWATLVEGLLLIGVGLWYVRGLW